MAERIPIPPHLGGGFVDDPGPAPMEKRARALRNAWRIEACRAYLAYRRRVNGDQAPLDAEPWRPDEIEECRRFARMKRDE